jgi:hypothetical protein
MKQRLILEVAFVRVRSKFLLRILHLSIQAFDRSITHLVIAGTNPDFSDSVLACFDGFRPEIVDIECQHLNRAS